MASWTNWHTCTTHTHFFTRRSLCLHSQCFPKPNQWSELSLQPIYIMIHIRGAKDWDLCLCYSAENNLHYDTEHKTLKKEKPTSTLFTGDFGKNGFQSTQCFVTYAWLKCEWNVWIYYTENVRVSIFPSTGILWITEERKVDYWILCLGINIQCSQTICLT